MFRRRREKRAFRERALEEAVGLQHAINRLSAGATEIDTAARRELRETAGSPPACPTCGASLRIRVASGRSVGHLPKEQGYLELDGTQDGEPGEGDPAQHWLSADEYRQLSTAERNQIALDRYLRSRKNPWQLGRDYERYVGYLREHEDWQVNYQGIFKGFEDLGRDLVCVKGAEVEIVQCKRWAQSKTIHEKHVFQLFGSGMRDRTSRGVPRRLPRAER